MKTKKEFVKNFGVYYVDLKKCKDNYGVKKGEIMSDLDYLLNEFLMQWLWDGILSHDDYLGIKNQIIATKEGYDVI